jgi:hypothetical protein
MADSGAGEAVNETTRRYYERIDAQNAEREKSRRLAWRRHESGTTPTWIRGHRLFYSAGTLRWRWVVREGWHGRIIGEGRAWTLGGVFRASKGF